MVKENKHLNPTKTNPVALLHDAFNNTAPTAELLNTNRHR